MLFETRNIKARSPPRIQNDRISPQYGKNVLSIEPIMIIGLSASNESNIIPANNAIGKKKKPTADSAQKVRSIRLVNR